MIYEDQIRDVLLRDWDPFCINQNPNLKDEYDPFISQIVFRLQARQSTKQIYEYLNNLEIELKAPIDDAQRLVAADALAKIPDEHNDKRT